MQITSTLTNSSGEVLPVTYNDIEDEHTFRKDIQDVHAYCFCDNKLIIVYSEQKGYWSPPGGKREAGETIEETVSREVHEETNMRVINQRLIGYQDIYEKERIVSQSRSVCLVTPYGDFTNDPDGDVTEIKCIDPHIYQSYFDWGEIGDHIIQQALKLKENMRN